MRVHRPTALVVFLFVWTLTTHGKYSASGDEPHYLIVSHSLLADGDLDLADNYAGDHGRHFGHDGLERGLHALPDARGRMSTIHGVGLGVLVAPAYAVGLGVASLVPEGVLVRMRMTRGLLAYSIVSLTLVAAGALALGILAHALGSLVSPAAAATLAIVVGISPPVSSHLFLVFPDTVALIVTCLGVAMALRPPDIAARWPWTIVAAIATLPWLHHKYLLFAPALLAAIAWLQRDWLACQARQRHATLAATALLPSLALLAWTRYTWGTFGGALTTDALPFSFSMFQHGLPGLWLDERAGLLAYAPVYALIPAAVVLAWRASWPWLLPMAALVLPAASFTIGWWAGFAPGARYVLPLVPLAMPALAVALRTTPMRVAAALLLLPQLAIDVAAWNRPRSLWPNDSGNRILHALGAPGRAYAQWLPDLQDGPAVDAVIPALLWAAASVALIAVHRWRAV